MNTSSVLMQVTDKMGYDSATLGDFTPCGSLHATEIGLARCQSELLVHALGIIGKHLKTHNASRAKVQGLTDQMFVLTAIMVCGDTEGTTTTTDEDGDAFIETNRVPLSRLVLAAYTATLPGLLREMGIASEC
jgi:hypothetical protein